MAVTYTNRKGVVYHLVVGRTKTGRPRYQFSRDAAGTPVDEIPEGYEISESVNGIVSLTKARPSKILAEEFKAVCEALARHPRGGEYRVTDKRDRIAVYERLGGSVDDLLDALGGIGAFPRLAKKEHLAGLRATFERKSQYREILRFHPEGDKKRTFRAERYCDLGMGSWIMIGYDPLPELIRRILPAMGTDDWFELI